MRPKAMCAVVLLAFATVTLRAQSLADVAKKEEERRQQLPTPGKVYTNKDLVPGPISVTGQPPTPDTSADAGDKADKDKADKDKTDQKDKKDTKASDGKQKDQKYWADRHKKITDEIDRDSTYADALQSRINALTTDFVNRDDPVQRAQIEQDRQKALAELARLKEEMEAAKKALADLEEEARRAGVPPGWLR